MPVRLTIDVLSPEGAALSRELEEYHDILAYECGCPDGRYCNVVVEEGRKQRYDVIVTRSGYSPPPDDSWLVIRKNTECCYIRAFEKPTSEMLATAVLHLVSIPLLELL